jgi:peroxiredoxin
VPEDRFGDLGPRGDAPPRAAERLADLDAREPEQAPPSRRAPGRSYTWVVGVAAVILIAVVGLNSLPNAGEGIRGPRAGSVIPAFAAPSATGPLDGDVNLKQGPDDKRFRNKTAACDVHQPGVVNICDLRRRGAVVIVFIGVPGAKKCEAQLDRVNRMTREFKGVSFVGVVSGRDKKTVARLVARHGWTLPVAVDQRGDLFTLYRAAICPTIVFAHRGGQVSASTIRPLTDTRFRALVRAAMRPPPAAPKTGTTG